MRKQTLIIALACTGWTVKAQDSLKTVQLDEVVVTGTKSEIPVEKSGKSIFKITRKEIETSGGRNVADLLNEVPGVQMDGNFGPLGTNIGYFVRGSSSKRTLILIDGIPFNDPSGIDQTYDLRLLDLSQVESIEVLKGGLSSLYGSGAAAGVINITLKKSTNDGLAGSFGVDYGNFKTLNTTLNLSGKLDKISYLFSSGYKKSEGFSSAKDDSGNGDFDSDGFEGYNILGRIGYDFSKSFSMTFTGALDDFYTEYDQGAFADGDNTSDNRQMRMGFSPKYKWQSGHLHGDLFYSKIDRLFNSPDFFDPNARFIDEYNGENIQVDLIVDQNLSEKLKLIGGLNFQKLSYSQPDVDETSFNMIDPYLSFIYDQSDFNLQVGARLNQHSEYGSNLVYNINPSYLIGLNTFDLKFISSYSTSFVTPSLFQLFGPYGANPNLEPEESQSAEGGFSIGGEKINFEAVYFYRKDENLIVYNGAFEYENAGDLIETDGLEFNGQVKVTDQIDLFANYTFVRRLDESKLYRIPAHKYGASLSYQPLEVLSLSLNYLHTGDRRQQYFDNDTFSTEETELEEFDLVDAVVTYRYRKFTFSGSLNNVFDENYQAIYGFNSVGRNYRLGIKYHFN
jgi:vitamin B12 transporter